MKKISIIIAIILAALVAGCTNPPGVDLPGDAKYAFTIGASDINKRLASFSSWGPTDDMRTKPEVSAPGVSIIAPRASGTSMGTPVNTYYTNASGTSMATPQVAGAAALLMQASLAQGYSHTPSGIKAALMNSAVPMVDAGGKPYNEYGQGKGLINVTAAFNLLSNIQLTSITPSKFNTTNPNANFKIVLINDQPATSVSLSTSASWITVSPNSVTSISANNHTVFNVALSAGGMPLPLEGSVTVSVAGITYTIPVRVVTLQDTYEPDNTMSQANWIQNGETQTHNFNPAGDQNWMKFNATQATKHLIETSKLGSAADTVMYLYNAVGQQLAYDDDSGEGLASKILWTAPSSGIYYIKVIDYGNNAYGPNTNYDITLLALQDYENSYLFEDTEFGINNWNATGLWHISQHRSYSPTHAWYYGQEGTWNYNTGARTFGNLTSPAIDLTGKSTAMLSFWRWEQTEGGSTWDVREVYVSSSASGYTNWTKIYTSAGNNQYQWYKEYVPLTSYAGKVIKIRFRFDTIDALNNNYEGWYVDNINITGPPPPNVTTVFIDDVTLAPNGTVTTPILIKNVTDAGAAQVNLYYNPSVVHVTGVANSSFDVLVSNIDNATGVAIIGAYQAFSSGLNGNVRLANVTLRAIGSPGASTPLSLSITTLKNPFSVTIPANVDNGSATIVAMLSVSITETPDPVTSGSTSQIIVYVGSSVQASIPQNINSQMITNTSIVPIPPPPASMTLEAVPTTVQADGISYSTIIATLSDSSGQPSPGANVYFNTNFGNLSTTNGLYLYGWLNITDAQGKAYATIKSASTGSAVVTATSGNLTKTVAVNFTLPVSGANVCVSAAGGSLSPVCGTTNATGYFTSTYTAPTVTTTQTYSICATATKSGYSNGTACDTMTVNPVTTVVSISDTTLRLNKTGVVPIMIKNVTNAGAATVDLSYNPSVVHVINVANSSFDTTMSNINNATGITIIGAFQITSAGLDGDIKLADVTLKAVGSSGQISPLNLSITTLKTTDNVQIKATTLNGTFMIAVNDTTSPSVTSASANPYEILLEEPDNLDYKHMTTRLNATVTDESAIASVAINLSSIGGSSVQPMSNIGGDVYSVTTNATGLPGSKLLRVNATDIYGNSNTSVSISLKVTRNGDVNEDGAVDIADAMWLAKNRIGFSSYPINELAADVNGDGVIDIADAMYIAKHVIQKPGYEKLY